MSMQRHSGKERLYADMRRLLATLMQRDIADPRLAGVSITRTEAVHGGQQLRVLVHRPGEKEPEACVKLLNQLAPHLAHELRHAMPKRRLPGLKFCWDDAIDGAASVNSLLASLQLQRAAPESEEEQDHG